MVNNFLKVSDKGRRTHLKVLVNFLANSEKPHSDSTVELDQMSEESLHGLLSIFVDEAFVVDELVGPSENCFLISGGEVRVLFWILLTDMLVLGEGVLKFVLILLILIHNCFIL